MQDLGSCSPWKKERQTRTGFGDRSSKCPIGTGIRKPLSSLAQRLELSLAFQDFVCLSYLGIDLDEGFLL